MTSELIISKIDRLIIHTIFPKTDDQDAYAVFGENLIDFENDEKLVLIERIHTALRNQKKTYRLQFDSSVVESKEDSFKNISQFSTGEFTIFSKSLAEDIADSLFRKNIPGGYLLFGNGELINNTCFSFVIKAEHQEVFNFDEDSGKMSLIKNVFLSPARDFYKIGLFVEGDNKVIPYVYDDQFSMQKRDLTEYFYGKFLGLTTDKNDKLKSKNFFEDTKKFIDKHVDNHPDRHGLQKALFASMREETSGMLSAQKFSEDYLEGELQKKYKKEVVEKYPTAFVRDLQLIENRIELERVSIRLSYMTKLVGTLRSMDHIEILNDPQNEYKKLESIVNTGEVKQMVVFKTVANL